jgi:hypothetical protein
MSFPVVTVASGGLPVVDVTAIAPLRGVTVTEAANGRGLAVTKVVGKPGLPVVYLAQATVEPHLNDQADRSRAGKVARR